MPGRPGHTQRMHETATATTADEVLSISRTQSGPRQSACERLRIALLADPLTQPNGPPSASTQPAPGLIAVQRSRDTVEPLDRAHGDATAQAFSDRARQTANRDAIWQRGSAHRSEEDGI